VQTIRDGRGLRHVHVWHAPYRRACLAWCSLVLVLGVCTGQAVMRTLSIEELAGKADMIVLGTVIQQESAWDAQHTVISTTVTLAVVRTLAGPSAEVVTLQVTGGIVGTMGMRTSTDAEFRDGERVIVFLNTSTVPSTVVGMQQGKFTVQDNTVIGAGTTWLLDDFIAAVLAAAR
jgi:hypothetical protein